MNKKPTPPTVLFSSSAPQAFSVTSAFETSVTFAAGASVTSVVGADDAAPSRESRRSATVRRMFGSFEGNSKRKMMRNVDVVLMRNVDIVLMGNANIVLTTTESKTFI